MLFVCGVVADRYEESSEYNEIISAPQLIGFSISALEKLQNDCYSRNAFELIKIYLPRTSWLGHHHCQSAFPNVPPCERTGSITRVQKGVQFPPRKSNATMHDGSVVFAGERQMMNFVHSITQSTNPVVSAGTQLTVWREGGPNDGLHGRTRECVYLGAFAKHKS